MSEELTLPLTGGCACGAVRYRCDEKPLVQAICHCRDCQRASGGAFGALFVVPTDRVSYETKTPKYWEKKADSGNTMQRGFCDNCGSPLSIYRPETPAMTFLTAASLDNPELFQPQSEVWTSKASSWHPHCEHTKKFTDAPPDHAIKDIVVNYFRGRKTVT